MTRILAFILTASIATAASAQIVYQPVRFQYGPTNDIVYGGRNPGVIAEAATPPAAIDLTGNSQGPGGYAIPPYAPVSTMTSPNYKPMVYSDLAPYTEVGHLGYNTNDARNEAYNNVPRIQYGTLNPPTPAAAAAPAQSANAAPLDPRIKVIPLLDWAKAERTRNPQLYADIMSEARKLDPVAAANAEQNFASEK